MFILKQLFVFFLILGLFTPALSYSAQSEFVQKFSQALDKDDSDKMNSLVKDNIAQIPTDVEEILAESLLPETSGNDKEGLFYLAEQIARSYMDSTGKTELLRGVKRRSFETKLSSPVRMPADKKLHIVEATSTDKVKNFFKPDNIIIKKGDTVRWLNSDKVAHLVGSVGFLGRGGIMTSRFNSGESQEYTFKEAGQYYYVCFIHKMMYAKITVEE